MSYVEGVDYWVRLVEFPSMASSAVTVSNGDGTFTIYINTRFCPERQAEGLRHELRHVADQHFSRPASGSCESAAAATGLLTRSAPAHGPQPVAEPGRRNIRLYPDAGAVLEDFLRRASPESIKRLREAGLEL